MGERMVSADEAREALDAWSHGRYTHHLGQIDLAHAVVELSAQLDAEKARADAAEAKVRAVEEVAVLYPTRIPTEALSAALADPEAQS